jgi:tetratricopeptide (TPR) repeat protein
MLLPSIALSAGDLSNNELFSNGNEYYKNGEYGKAIEHYERIVSDGVRNGSLFYNLGNAYFKQGSIGKSILYYEKARKYLPRDRELAENISFARAFLQDRIEEKEQPFVIFIFSAILAKFTLREVAATASVVLSITLACAILLIYRKSLLLKDITLSLIVVALLAGLLLAAKYRYEFTKRGIVTDDLAEIRSAPSEAATVEFIIHEGTELQIVEKISEWAKVRLKDGKTGWTTSSTYGII